MSRYRKAVVAVVIVLVLAIIAFLFSWLPPSALARAPDVVREAATYVTTNSAILNGNLTAMGTAARVTVSFQWATDDYYRSNWNTYGSETSAQIMAATGLFSSNLTGLSPGTMYHYRAKAVGDGTAYGSDLTFTTSVSPGDFTIVVLPDTQRYCALYPEIFKSQTQWIVANRSTWNIAFVTHEGDIVADTGNITQWENANAAMSVLDGQVPYGVLPGNHDMYPTSSVSGTQMYNTYFPYTRYQGQAWYGGHYGTTNDNNYELFSAGGMNFIIFHLSYNAPSSAITWASSVLQSYPERRVIVGCHNALQGDSTDNSFSNTGSLIYNSLKTNLNFFLMVCGNVPSNCGFSRSDTYDGNTLYTLCTDFESREKGGSGYLRILDFSPGTNTIHVKTYSPYLNQYDTSSQCQFDIPYTMPPEVSTDQPPI